MKKIMLLGLLLINQLCFAQSNIDWSGTVVFPANFKVGDYIEFLVVQPMDAGASGNYEISITYTRGNVAAAASHLASISHYNPDIWREVGRINSNGYSSNPSNSYCFTVDCNTQYAYPRFRIRAVNVLGVTTSDLPVHIKVRSINLNAGWIPLNVSGTDLTMKTFLPMTNDWSLYVGNSYLPDGANLAIKAIENGNVGIGISSPSEKLSVNGNIRAKEIKVETQNWPDYVFKSNYSLPSLEATEKHIKEKGHLPGIPSAAEAEEQGINLSEMNGKLLKKIEELTLYLIEMKKKQDQQELKIKELSGKQ